MQKIILFFFFFSIISCCSRAQQSETELTTAIQKIWEESDFPGFSVATVDLQGIQYQQGFGFADRKNQRPYTTQTIQQIASVSKTFIGVAIMKAQEMGLVHLDSPINQLLPFQVINPHFPDVQITLRDLATHTASLNDRPLFYEFKSVYTEKTPNIDLATFMKNYFAKGGKWYAKRNFHKNKPGTLYNYSNLGATLAAYIIELATKKPFHQFSKEVIFDPIKMKDAGWFYGDINETKALHNCDLS